ncbi:hypothetical protein KEM55_007166 [Ascosphaera atra]|nr:hypothetical protein KEM55_007166 [Ascosphaera atra]
MAQGATRDHPVKERPKATTAPATGAEPLCTCGHRHPPFEIRNKKYSDLTMRFADTCLHVHRVIVCSASPVIAAYCDEHYKEKQHATITIDNYDSSTVCGMLEWMYDGQYVAADSSSRSSRDSAADTAEIMSLHLNIGCIADQYQVPALRELANRRLISLLQKRWGLKLFALLVDAMGRGPETLRQDERLVEFVAEQMLGHAKELVEVKEFREGEFPKSVLLKLLEIVPARVLG